MTRAQLSGIMKSAWGFIRRNGFTLSEALKQAWLNFKLKAKMVKGIVKFYFQKVDGSIREAWGTLANRLIPHIERTGRNTCPTVQAYWDTEKEEWRCYKIANLIKIV